MNLIGAVNKVIETSAVGENPFIFFARLPKLEYYPEATTEEIADASELILKHAQKLHDHLEMRISR